jgi:hypothetical protein
MAGQQSRRDKKRSAFGYVVGHLYFYGQKDWPGGTSYECRCIGKPFPLGGIPGKLLNRIEGTFQIVILFLNIIVVL